MGNGGPAGQPRSALEVVVEAAGQVRTTDPHDTPASLRAAWHAFGTAQAAGLFLAEDNPEHAVLATNARPVLNAAGRRLQQAPSLKSVPRVVQEAVTGLVPDRPAPRGMTNTGIYCDPDPHAPADPSPAAGVVRQAIIGLSFDVNSLLSHAAGVGSPRLISGFARAAVVKNRSRS
jgi:hypothetical protein